MGTCPCGIYPIIFEISEKESDLIFLFLINISPESILCNPFKHLIKVVLPVPLGPNIHVKYLLY